MVNRHLIINMVIIMLALLSGLVLRGVPLELQAAYIRWQLAGPQRGVYAAWEKSIWNLEEEVVDEESGEAASIRELSTAFEAERSWRSKVFNADLMFLSTNGYLAKNSVHGTVKNTLFGELGDYLIK